MGAPSDRFSNNIDRFLFNGQTSQLGNPGLPIRESTDRWECITDVATSLATGVMTCVGVPMRAGDIATNIAVKSGATAAGTPTHWWFALYTPAGALVAQTADQTSTAWAAATTKDLALSGGPYTIAADGVYYVGIMMAATTVISIPCMVLGHSGMSAGALAAQVTLAETSGSALTATAPATIASPTAVVNIPYVIVH